MVSPDELNDRFAANMARLGPFEPRPRLAVAVSGGADSTALMLLAFEWVSRRNGSALALIVDHGLRPGSAAEASLTSHRLAEASIPSRVLTLSDLQRGPGLAERARAARYRVLEQACVAEGIPHLLIGHHRGDQVETVMARVLSASAARGLAAMPALTETRFVRLLRPLLDVQPGDLRDCLIARGIDWVEDPSNQDPTAQRVRLRLARGEPRGDGPGTAAVARAARVAGRNRAARDMVIARVLAERAVIRPEGFAILSPGSIDPEALAALLLMIGGGAYAPPIDRVADIARSPEPRTLAGVRIMDAGRLGPGWLLARERRAMAEPVCARPNAVWDGRFRLAGGPPDAFTVGLELGALGAGAAQFRDRAGPPAAVLHGLPALRLGGTVVAVPHIGVGDPRWRLLFDPRNRAAGAPFSFG